MTEYKTAHSDYSLEEYNPSWAKKFEVIKSLVADVFEDKVLSIEHVGSTSIVGMKAKPIIDVLVIVRDIKNLHTEKTRMGALGYLYKENYIAANSLFFCKDVDGKRVENIHVLPENHVRIAQFIDKRDYLRKHPEEALRYQQIKEKAAKQFPNDYNAYKKGKDDYLNIELVEKVKKWKLE